MYALLGPFACPVGVSSGGQHVGVVTEAIQQGGRELLVAEDLYPLPEGEIGGDESATDLMPLGDEVEQ